MYIMIIIIKFGGVYGGRNFSGGSNKIGLSVYSAVARKSTSLNCNAHGLLGKQLNRFIKRHSRERIRGAEMVRWAVAKTEWKRCRRNVVRVSQEQTLEGDYSKLQELPSETSSIKSCCCVQNVSLCH